jgi:hypothetical protein
MNANELANLLEVDSWYKLVTREEIATMLRQQQAEIDALKQRIEYMREKASLWEAEAHAGGFEAGRQQGFFDRAREVAKKIDNNEYHTPED